MPGPRRPARRVSESPARHRGADRHPQPTATPSKTARPTSSAWTTSTIARPFAAGSPTSPRRNISRTPPAAPPRSTIARRSSATPTAKPCTPTIAAGPIRAVPIVPCLQSHRQVSISLHAAGRRAVPRRGRALPAADLAGGRLRPVRRRARRSGASTPICWAAILTRASPGDLLFFRQEADHMPFHSMIYLGESQLRPDGHRYILYHTGPTARTPARSAG